MVFIQILHEITCKPRKMLVLLLCIWFCCILCLEAVDKAKDASINLAFGIMLYDKAGQSEYTKRSFERLMKSIYKTDKHLYIMHIDAKTDEKLMKSIHGDYCNSIDRFHNCGYIRPRNVVWGAPSVVEMNLAIMQAAYEFPYLQYEYLDAFEQNKINSNIVRQKLPYQWDYFIFIGHESMPLMTMSYIEQFFMSVKHGKHPNSNQEPEDDEDDESFHLYPKDTNFINCWDSHGHDFFGQHEDVIDRLKKVVIESPDGYLIENIHYHDWHQDEYHQLQRSIPDKKTQLKIYKTIQYITLTKSSCQYILYGPETRRILLYFANVKASDELVIPTIFQINSILSKTASCDTTLHYTHWARPGGTWHPEILTMEHLPLILNTTKHLFLRKVNDDSTDVLQTLDEIRSLIGYDNLYTHIKLSKALHKEPESESESESVEKSTVTVSVDGTSASASIIDKSLEESTQTAMTALLPPLQNKNLLESLPRSIIIRGVDHIVKVAVNDNNGDGGGVDPITFPEEKSTRAMAYTMLKTLFPEYLWSEQTQIQAVDENVQLKSLISFWNKWKNNCNDNENKNKNKNSNSNNDDNSINTSINSNHIQINDILTALNTVRARRDAIEGEKFREYWRHYWEKQRLQEEQKRMEKKSFVNKKI